MENKISMEELLERYQKMCSDSLRRYPDYYRSPDLKFVNDFFKGVDCREYYFKDAERSWYNKDRFVRLYAPLIEANEQVAFLDTTLFELISKNKRVSLTLERNDPENNLAPNDAIEMVDSTPDGIYLFRLRDYLGLGGSRYSCDMYFYPDEELRNVGIDKPIFLLIDTNAVVVNKTLSIVEEDIPKIANKIYRNGLPYLHEIFKNGGTLEITDEDRKYYELAAEKDITKENKKSNEKRTVEQLIALRDMGIELSPEQYSMISLHERLNSEKFQLYKENSEARKERQKEVREQIIAENERKESWHNSPENPTNKRIAELEHMKRQIEGLKALRDIDDSLLSNEQRELMEEGNVFFEMLTEAQTKEHEIDTGMSPEIRSWYQDYYADGESKFRK